MEAAIPAVEGADCRFVVSGKFGVAMPHFVDEGVKLNGGRCLELLDVAYASEIISHCGEHLEPDVVFQQDDAPARS